MRVGAGVRGRVGTGVRGRVGTGVWVRESAPNVHAAQLAEHLVRGRTGG